MNTDNIIKLQKEIREINYHYEDLCRKYGKEYDEKMKELENKFIDTKFFCVFVKLINVEKVYQIGWFSRYNLAKYYWAKIEDHCLANNIKIEWININFSKKPITSGEFKKIDKFQIDAF